MRQNIDRKSGLENTENQKKVVNSIQNFINAFVHKEEIQTRKRLFETLDTNHDEGVEAHEQNLFFFIFRQKNKKHLSCARR